MSREKRNAYMRRYYKEHRESCGRRSIRVGKKVVSLARHNATMVIGRTLGNDEVVHHIDGDVSNDAYDNLMVFSSQGDHLAYHRGEDVLPVSAEII